MNIKEKYQKEIIPKLKKNFEVIIIAPNFGPTKTSGIKLIKLPLRKIKMGDYHPAKFQYSKIKKEIQNADVVFTQTIGPIGLGSIFAARRFNKPLVSFIHSVERELFPKAISSNILKKFAYPIVTSLTRFIYNKSSLLIVPSSSIADILMWQGIKTRKYIAHLGVDTKKFIKKDKDLAKKKLGYTKNDFVIGYHGRLGREKDLKTLLRAYVRMRSKYDNVKLLIVGSGVKEVEDLFRNQKGVNMVGSQDNVVPFINAMDVYAIPSLTETSSLTTLEAMACEIPVIATQVGFIQDYIENGVNGLFFKMQDPYDLKKNLELLYNNSMLRRTLGKKARETILEKFRWEVTAERIVSAIENVVLNLEQKE